MNGYENARSIELIPKSIVKKLNCNKIKNAMVQRIITYKKDLFIDILPDAIGLCLVLFTLLSKFLSTISLNIQPALLINTEPKKQNDIVKK